MILRTPLILLVCWLIGITTAIPFRNNPKNIKQNTKKLNHLLEDKEARRHFYQPPRRDKFNPLFGPKSRKALDYFDEYHPKEDVHYNSESSDFFPDDVKNYPYMKKTSQNVYKDSKKLQSFPNFRQISQDYSSLEDQSLDSTEDSSQEDSDYSDEEEKYEDSKTSAPEDSITSTTEDSTTLASKNSETSAHKSSLSPKIEEHILEKNVIENWIPTNCSRSARKSNDRYSSSFVFNNTRDGLNEDTFPNPGEAESVRHSSVFVGEDVTLCWIEIITIKEDKSIKPPKKVVLREFTISFENSATIPEKYLECGKLEGEVEPGCHNHGGKSGLFDVIDEDSKVSKLVNFTTVSNKGNIEVRQHKNVRCAVGPVVTKNVIEFKDGSKNPKKRVEVKVSPRLRRMSEAGEKCPADQEKIDVPPKNKPGVTELPENKGDPKGKSNEFDEMIRKSDRKPEEVSKKPEEKPGRIHDKPEEVPDMIDKKPEEKPHLITKKPIGEHPVSRRPSKFNPSTLDESIPHDDEENDKVKLVKEISDVSSTTHKQDDITEIENPDSSGSPKAPNEFVKNNESTPDLESMGDGDGSCKGKSCKSEGNTQLPQYANTRKALQPSSATQKIFEESTTESQSTEDSTLNKSVLDKPTEDIFIKNQVTASSIRQQTSRSEIDDEDLGFSTTEKSSTSVIIPTDRKPSVDTETTDERKIDESRTRGPSAKKLEDETKKKFIPSNESGTTTSIPEINQEPENKSELCEGDCSTVPTKSSSKVYKENIKPANDEIRKSATVSPSNEEEKPSGKELVAFPTTRKSSSINIHPSDVETESVAPEMQELDSEESGGHPTSLRPQEDKANVPYSLEEGTSKRPIHISSNNLVHVEEAEKDFTCESGSCLKSLDDMSVSSEGTTKSPKGGKDPHREGRKSSLGRIESSNDVSEPEESPESTTKSPEGIKKSSEDMSKSPNSPNSPEESLESPKSMSNTPKGTVKLFESVKDSSKSLESTTESLKGTTNSKEKLKEAPDDELNAKARSEYPKSETIYSKTEPDDNEGITDNYSDGAESNHSPSFIKTTISPEQQPRDLNEGSDSELKNRSGETLLDRTPETTTELSLLEKATPQCSPDDEECNSINKISISEPVSKNKEFKPNKEINQTAISNPNVELNLNGSIPDILHKSVSMSSSSGKHRLGLRIKILLEHINENEERKNLVEVDKHLLLNEDANDHDNNTILNQIKALNDSVTAQTIKALLNCSTLEKLTKKGISVQVDEAALVPKGKEDSKNLEPNEFILSVEDKGLNGEKVAKLRRKRDIHEDSFKDDNSTTVSSTEETSTVSSTEENSTDANTKETISTVENSSDNTEVPIPIVENVTDTNTKAPTSTVPNSTNYNTEDAISTTENIKKTTSDYNHLEADDTIKIPSETIKDYLPDLKWDINTGINHVISKLKNCTTLNSSEESAAINFLPISSILGIISDPKDSRIKSRNKRNAKDYGKEKYDFEKLDNWSNERIKRAAGGHHLRSLTEFTIFREA
ncbi:uncharacterized protein LOC117172506 isoform X2 [Belonocnema kinseyi]|uniref:uncharacterized protein LOC117172506 isoform X2 n=1 Tax=Belonocnema kinseyi TaxID=2817044 RepID=UPI00143DDF71|nr:uncharacterized protein LOC117172506 isoform X2 [Belonocnema kinseyi]